MVLWKGGKAKKLRRATKMYALGEAGLAGKYISATVAGGRHGGTLYFSFGQKTNREDISLSGGRHGFDYNAIF